MIITPADDPLGYSLSWRHEYAGARARGDCALSRKGLDYAESDADNQQRVFRHSTYLGMVGAGIDTMTAEAWSEYPDHALVHRWYKDAASNAREHIEALLMTDMPTDAIAKDVGTEVNLIDLYESLFFNCRPHGLPFSNVRNDHAVYGTHPRDNIRRLPNHVKDKRTGSLYGYETLITRWGWVFRGGSPDMEEIRKIAVDAGLGDMVQKITDGRMEPVDIIGFLSHNTAHSKQAEELTQGSKDNAYVILADILLEALQPPLNTRLMDMQMAGDDEEGAVLEAAARREVDGTEITDKGIDLTIQDVNNSLKNVLSVLASDEGK